MCRQHSHDSFISTAIHTGQCLYRPTITTRVDKAMTIVTVSVCRSQTQRKLSSEVQNSGVHTATVQTPIPSLRSISKFKRNRSLVAKFIPLYDPL